jgi:hypothetical protein
VAGNAEGVRRPNLLVVAYLAIGVLLAADRHYYASLETARRVASALLATALWPLLLLGIDLHIR